MDHRTDTAAELATFDMCALSDALGMGLGLAEELGDEFCAVWLGDDDGVTLDFVICAEGSARNADDLVHCAAVAVALLEATRVVLWTSDDDLTDGPRLADRYFVHRDLVSDAGGTLVDEIVVGEDELRSMAITTFTDEPWWDDVSHRIELGDG